MYHNYHKKRLLVLEFKIRPYKIIRERMKAEEILLERITENSLRWFGHLRMRDER